MSVFKKLKGTFQTAQQGLVDGLRSVTLFEGYSKHDQLQHIKSKEINLDVGADLLHEYQKVWSSIQNETKVCSKKAEEVDVCLSPMFVVWDKRAEVIAALEEETKSIPGVVSSLKELHTLLETIRQDFSVVEASLSMLENVCEEQDLKKAMENETRKLNVYRCLKESETEKVKVNLAQNHAKKMQHIESCKTIKLKERAEAFTSAFQEDVDYYKTHGQPEIADSSPSDGKLVTEFPKVTSLSEISIDDDGKDLDTFLGPPAEEEQEDPGASESYFEDDYTADFSIKVKEDVEEPDNDEDMKSSVLLPDEDEDYSNDENENVVSDKGKYPTNYLIQHEVIEGEGQATAEEEEISNDKTNGDSKDTDEKSQ